MSAPADANIHAGREEVESPHCALATVWCRDPVDGRCIVALLHRLAKRRGVGGQTRRLVQRRGQLDRERATQLHQATLHRQRGLTRLEVIAVTGRGGKRILEAPHLLLGGQHLAPVARARPPAGIDRVGFAVREYS